MPELNAVLEYGSAAAINWFKENKITVNSDKFQTILTDKRQWDHTDEKILIDLVNLDIVLSIKLLRVQLVLIITCLRGKFEINIPRTVF